MTRDTVVLASIASALLVAAYGGGDPGFRAALLTLGSLWVVAAAAVLVLDRRADVMRTGGPSRPSA